MAVHSQVGLFTVRRLYDGGALVAEYDQTGAMLRRFVHGPNTGADTPLVWYEGATMSQSAARMLSTDLQGSVTSVTDFNGNPIAINRYDEYGRPQSGNIGRFQYTGQAWLPEIGMYYYKARMYSPTLGRFMQTDPIGYADGVNWYNYVGGDPVNGVDPSGNAQVCTTTVGSRVRKCVDVDGDGNGNAKEDDMSPHEIARFSAQFHEFILRNNGRNLTSNGRSVDGPASESEKVVMRVTLQFFGAALKDGIVSFPDNRMISAWNDLKSVWLGQNPRKSNLPAWSDGVSRMGIDPTSKWFMPGPSNIARMIAHELMDWGVGEMSYLRPIHMYNDLQARNFIKRSGLGDGGCLANPPFPAC